MVATWTGTSPRISRTSSSTSTCTRLDVICTKGLGGDRDWAVTEDLSRVNARALTLRLRLCMCVCAWSSQERICVCLVCLSLFLTLSQAGELLYSATGAVGFVGFLNGMRIKVGWGVVGGCWDVSQLQCDGYWLFILNSLPPFFSSCQGEKWTVSQDARNHGGRIPINIAQALKTHCLTPEQAIRKVLESDLGANGFSGAVSALSDIPIVDDVYYVMSGTGHLHLLETAILKYLHRFQPRNQAHHLICTEVPRCSFQPGTTPSRCFHAPL